MITLGAFCLCAAFGHLLLPAVSAATGRRRLDIRLTRAGAVVDTVLVVVGLVLIAAGS